jgi:hypothetical protein
MSGEATTDYQEYANSVRRMGAMKKQSIAGPRELRAGSRIVASLKEAVDWVEGKDVAVRVTTVDAPTVDVSAARKLRGLRAG